MTRPVGSAGITSPTLVHTYDGRPGPWLGARIRHPSHGNRPPELGQNSSPAQAGSTRTGMPLSTVLPESGSTAVESVSTLLLTPGCALATDCRVPGTS